MISRSGDETKWSFKVLSGVGSLAVICLWYFVGVVLPHYYNPNEAEFGDAFAGANALFAGLAFLGLILTIRQQQEELEATRAELRGQKEQLQIQNQTASRQRFENTFFRLLKIHHDIAETIVRPDIPSRSAIPQLANRLHQSFEVERGKRTGAPVQEVLDATFDLFMDSHERELGHYFRTLYHIVKFVDRSDVEDKKLYASLIRAQLSSDELVLLFFNCLSRRGCIKFKPMVEAYSLLKTVPKNCIRSEELWNMYDRAAFGGQRWQA